METVVYKNCGRCRRRFESIADSNFCDSCEDDKIQLPKAMTTDKKHKFKRKRGFQYIVLAYCEICGLEREGTKGGYTYRMPPSPKHHEIAPDCIDTITPKEK